MKSMGLGAMGGGDAALMNELKALGGDGPEMDPELAALEQMANGMDEDESEEALLRALDATMGVQKVPYDDYAGTKLQAENMKE
jgi:hypothetical protein